MRFDQVGPEITLGIIGLGCRSVSQIDVLLQMQDVRLAAVCDRYADRVGQAREKIGQARGQEPRGYTDYRELLREETLDAVMIFTGWQTHIPIAIEALRSGKAVGMEVGGANSVQECWDLVQVSEETGLPVMMLENCCYGKEEMALLQMVRAGLFGEVVHCQGGYEHDLRDEIGLGDVNRHYRQDHFRQRNAELYPTHELGPIAKYLNLNRGNRMLSLVSMASKAVGQHAWLQEHRPGEALAGMPFAQGDIVTTMIRCAGGETILLTHDCTLPRPYSRGGRIQGTRGLWMEDNRSIYIEGRSPTGRISYVHPWESDVAYMREYQHPLWAAYEEAGVRGGHDGMDFLVLRSFVESLQEKQAFPIDVYDTAAWMSITPLTEASIALGSAPVEVPDFTGGRWLEKREGHRGPYALDV